MQAHISLFMFLLASVFRLFTPQIKHLVWSFSKENYHCIEPHYVYLFVFLLAPAYIDNTYAKLLFFWLQYFDSLPLKKPLVSPFNNESYHCIEAHLFCFQMFLLASVFRQFTPQNKHLVSSFNKENDHCIEAHFFVCLCFVWQNSQGLWPRACQNRW